MQTGSSPRPGRQSPTPEPPGRQGLASIGPRADPCRPGEPGVARRVPDRGDDLTPYQWCARICARDAPGSSGTSETQGSSHRPGARQPPRPGSMPEIRRDARDLRRSSHNPEVAGSNPAPATNPQVRGPSDGGPLPYRDLVVGDVVKSASEARWHGVPRRRGGAGGPL
jgi:hypothetical protein